MNTFAKQSVGLIFWLALCFAASAIGALGSMNAPTFYDQLTQPDWAPAPWLFGPVWTALYAMMAIAAWLVWRKGGFRDNKVALSLFLGQLAFNALWSWLFFAWQLGGWAFIEIVILASLILATCITFYQTHRWSGILLVPYLGWVGFAALLNYRLWQLNPHFFG